MRIIILTVCAGALFALSQITPVQAQDYKYCVQGRGVGYPGDCSYSTRQQCLASASGRQVTCGINPRYAYGRHYRR